MNISKLSTGPYPSCLSSNLEEYRMAFKIFKKVHKNKLNIDEAIVRLKSIFINFSPLSSMEMMDDFVKRTLGHHEFCIEKVSSERGWSDNGTYWICDNQTKVRLLFLKVFKSASNFMDEMHGIRLLHEVQGVSSPKVIALGLVRENNDDSFVVAESLAPGYSFQHYYNEVGKCTIYSPERGNALIVLKEAARACGNSLAYLHLNKIGEKRGLPEHIKRSITTNFEKVKLKLAFEPSGDILIGKLSLTVNAILEASENEYYPVGMTHGDFKLIHAYYDVATKEISFIDPDHVPNSLDPSGNPTGMPAQDYFQFILSIILNRFGYTSNNDGAVFRKELLTEHEVDEVKNDFTRSYLEVGGKLPSKAIEACLLLRHDLGFVGNHTDRIAITPEPDKTRLIDLIEISFNNLKSISK